MSTPDLTMVEVAKAPSPSAPAPVHRGKQLRPLVRWVVGPLATILVSSFVIFGAMAIAPGDPVSQLLGSHPTAAAAAAARHRLGLDQPFTARYFEWLGGAVHGDFGLSITYRAPVSGLLAGRLETTLLLVAYAGALVLLVGIGLGILGAVIRPLGPVIAALSGIGIALPSYVAASVLVSIFVLQLGWFPALGAGVSFPDRLYHLTLPAIALAIGWSAYVTQVTRNALREEQGREHVETAISRGLRKGMVFRRHVLRNAAVPIFTASGLTVAGLVAGAVIVEEAFGIDGVGSFLVSSVENKDYNVVQAISLLLVVIFVVVTTALDGIHFALDPRLRDNRGGA